MSTIFDELSRVELGATSQFGNLRIYPLLRPKPSFPEPDYLLLDEAMTKGLVSVTELKGGGSVPDLQLENKCHRSVLLLDGEELLGAKQNRALNLTVLAPPRRRIIIPVSCVEAGRWSTSTSEFRSSPQLMYARARGSRVSQVTGSMQRSGTHTSDQPSIWADIRDKAAGLRVSSPTQAMSDVYESHAISVEEYVRAFQWSERQAGAVFAISERLVGFDLLDHPETMKRVYAKLVRSYALDALDYGNTRAEKSDPTAFTAMVTDLSGARSFAQPAVGLGKDIRFASDLLVGAALWAEDRYVHICGFPNNGHTATGGIQSRIERAKRRAQQQSRNSGSSLLLVDDDAQQLELRSYVFRNAGYSVVTTTDPMNAVAIAEEGNIVLAVLDYEMPVMNGCALAERLKRLRPELKIILHSGSVNISDSEMESTDAFVPKGIGVSNLLTRVSDLLQVPLQVEGSGISVGHGA